MDPNICTKDDFLLFNVTDTDYSEGAGHSTSQEIRCCTNDGSENSTNNPENADFSSNQKEQNYTNNDEPEQYTDAPKDSLMKTHNNDIYTFVHSEEVIQAKQTMILNFHSHLRILWTVESIIPYHVPS